MPSIASVARRWRLPPGGWPLAIRSAWSSARLVGRSLPLLIRPQPAGVPRLVEAEETHIVRVALRVLRLLARFGGGRWRDTCLFRAATECAVLRALGRPAVVRVGVAPGAGRTEMEAHAWAECRGRRCVTADAGDDGRYRPLA